jgi:hypothetical protein
VFKKPRYCVTSSIIDLIQKVFLVLGRLDHRNFKAHSDVRLRKATSISTVKSSLAIERHLANFFVCNYQCGHISAGDLLREEVNKKTSIGIAIEDTIMLRILISYVNYLVSAGKWMITGLATATIIMGAWFAYIGLR